MSDAAGDSGSGPSGSVSGIDLPRPCAITLPAASNAVTTKKSGAPIDPQKDYTVAGWASVNEGTQGPPVWELVERYVAAETSVRVTPNSSVKITGA